jgi:demethylmenaquinone methyltransferase/2-methoxy-6-polyprenyl-1,4-benzoquinol methylase
MTGLGKQWFDIVNTLLKVSSYYRELNNAISFGRDIKVRREAVERFLKNPKTVLDLGAGDGSLTEIVLDKYPNIDLLIMLDVLPEMLLKAKKAPNIEKIQAVFEYLPFRDSVFDYALAAFSLRDAIDLERALNEISNVLGGAGKLIVVDLGKPSNLLKRHLINFYWTIIAPLHAFLRLGFKGLSSIKIKKTLKFYPTTNQLLHIYNRYFYQTVLVEKFMGSVIILEASKIA